jgi:hypothetical protein
MWPKKLRRVSLVSGMEPVMCSSIMSPIAGRYMGDGSAHFQDMRTLEQIPVTLNHFSSSWPGSSRPSTPGLLSGRKKDVDARDKRGHDERTA